MIRKGHKPKSFKESSNMRRVFYLMEQGVIDRDVMAEVLQLRRRQIDTALHNLAFSGQVEACNKYKRHQRYTIYTPVGYKPSDTSSYAGVSFIFWAR